MRLNMFFTSASGPPRACLDSEPQPPAGATDKSQSVEPTTTPVLTPEDWVPVPRRRWWCLALIAELAIVALLTSAATARADTVVLAIAGSVSDVLNNIRNWIMGILAALATVFLSVGGVRYVMGGGDPGEVEKAKTAFKSAAWGYGLAVLAPLVVEILKGIVGA